MQKFYDHYGEYPHVTSPGNVSWWFGWKATGRITWRGVNKAMYLGLWEWDGPTPYTLAHIKYTLLGEVCPISYPSVYEAMYTYYQIHGETPTRETQGSVADFFGGSANSLTWADVEDIIQSDTCWQGPPQSQSLEALGIAVRS
tara:strand:- start:1688 stop:2116 length:429 start_codon:yes stop_codon:yes gene_type:complete